MTIVLYIIFLVLTYLGIKYAFGNGFIVTVPFSKDRKMMLSGPEMLMYFTFCTGVIGLTPVLSVRLAVIEILCLIGIAKSANKAVWSAPVMLYIVFLLWAVIGIFYSTSTGYGIRMLLKYLAPLLVCLFASSAVIDKELMLKCALGFRKWFLIGALVTFIPVVKFFFLGIFWFHTAMCTVSITAAVLSLSMFFVTKDKKELVWFAVFAFIPFYCVCRTDIMGLFVAVSAFFLVKDRFKALPLIGITGILAICSLFYIPVIKHKMYFNPDEVTIEDFLAGTVDENNIRTNGRKQMWEDVENNFVEGHEMKGSGTGRVQTFFYEDLPDGDWRKRGQVHGDFLVLRADNGYIGLFLYLLAYAAVLLHCMTIYQKSASRALKLCALVAGSSLLGIMATMYSDNTVSYSMVTLSYPWGFYGMALGMWRKEKAERQSQLA